MSTRRAIWGHIFDDRDGMSSVAINPTYTAAPTAAGQPILPEQAAALLQARTQAKPIRRAAGYAAFSGWTTAVFAALAILCGLFSVVSLLIGAAMAVIAWVELTNRSALLRLDTRASHRLALNQIGFAVVLTLYGVWGIYSTLTAPSRYAAYIRQGGELAEMLGPIENLTMTIALCVYIALIVLTWIFQGGAAIYYWSRAAAIRRYLCAVPPWVIALQRQTGQV